MREDDKTFLNLGMNTIQKLTKIGKINDTDTAIARLGKLYLDFLNFNTKKSDILGLHF